MVLVYVSHDPGGPAVVEAALGVSSSQGFNTSFGSEVVVHIDLGILVVGPSGPLVEVVLPEFPGSDSVRAEDGSIDVGELRPLIISPLCIEGVTIPSLVVWINEGVVLRFVGAGVGVLLGPWVKLSQGQGGEGYRVGLIGGCEWKSPARLSMSWSGPGKFLGHPNPVGRDIIPGFGFGFVWV